MTLKLIVNEKLAKLDELFFLFILFSSFYICTRNKKYFFRPNAWHAMILIAHVLSKATSIFFTNQAYSLYLLQPFLHLLVRLFLFGRRYVNNIVYVKNSALTGYYLRISYTSWINLYGLKLVISLLQTKN